MSDDLVKRLHSLHKQATVERSHFYVGRCAKDAIDRIEELTELCALEYQRAWLLETQKNIAEEKLAQQDDLVQAAVAAALREAVEIYRKLSEGSPVGAADGQTYHVRYVTNDEFARNILDLIPEGAQAALDRYVKERSDELVAEQRERIKGLVIIDEAGTVTPEMWDVAAATREGGE